jgi:hypothetical protein
MIHDLQFSYVGINTSHAINHNHMHTQPLRLLN